MLQGQLDLVLRLVIVIVVLSALLVALVAIFKVRRDGAERASTAFRRSMLDAWQARGEVRIVEALRPMANASVKRQSDLVAVCALAEQAPWWDDSMVEILRRASVSSGLADAMRRQLRNRRAARRGLAVVLGGYPIAQLDPRDLVRFTIDPNPTVRMAAVASLERIATEAAAEALIEALDRAMLPGPRLIERLGHPWAVTSVIDALATRTEDERVRCDLLRALALAADVRALDLAIEIARRGTAEERTQALRVIAATVEQADVATQLRAESAAMALVADPSASVRNQAVSVLRRLPAPAEIDALVTLAGDHDWFVRRSAARALASLGANGLDRLAHIAEGPDRFAAERAREELAMTAARTSEGGRP